MRTVSLARALSKLGFTSRSLAARLVIDGRVRVDGRLATDPDTWVDPRRARVEVDGRPLGRARPRTILLHKPAGVVTTRRDERGRRTIYDLLPPNLGWLFPVGRLDRETSGLLLLTNDTRLGDRLTTPASKVPKRYLVETDEPLSGAEIARLESGISLEGCRTLPARASRRAGRRLVLEIVEGRNRQVRRMLEALGRRVVSLHREAVGGLHLGRLPEGEWRELDAEEVRRLRG